MAGLISPRLRRGGERVLVEIATRGARSSAAATTAALAGAYVVTYFAGGTHTVMPHLFYVPVVVAASRFRHSGALAVAVCAGVLAGPAMPLNVIAGTSQEPLGWILRLGFFVVIGQVVALLCHRSLEGLSVAVADRRINAEIARALQREEFQVVYQPLVHLATGTEIGYEALVRWEHPQRGTLTPDKFIGAAERSGAIVAIGTCVLRQAVNQLRQWRSTMDACDLKMSVNISARQLEDEALAANVAAILHESGVPASGLQLEVTETSLVTDFTKATACLRQLRQVGVSIAIDDFGTGQSSLAYLHRFKADIIKIDRSFVKNIENEDQARAVAQGVACLAASLGATTVAEGIETKEQADILLSLGCDIGQGYYYARPTSPASIKPRPLAAAMA